MAPRYRHKHSFTGRNFFSAKSGVGDGGSLPHTGSAAVNRTPSPLSAQRRDVRWTRAKVGDEYFGESVVVSSTDTVGSWAKSLRRRLAINEL